MNVMLWNYRGYGRTKGNPNPQNIKSDSLSILNYMKKEMGIKGKFGVYGRSLGGIATTYLS
jgi:hypothetical protein